MAKLNGKSIHGGMAIIYAIVTMVNALDIIVAEAKSLKHTKGVVKTIKSYESGDVVDCIEIYKQPAFDHPLLKNHVIQMRPSSYSEGTKIENFQEKVLVEVECPEGTVPIRRTQNHISSQVASMISKKKILFHQNQDRKYAVVCLPAGQYFGGRAAINVWNPATENGESSLSQIWVSRYLESVEAGWIVEPSTEFGNATRLFAYWISGDDKGNNTTGCFNLDCPAFVLISRRKYLGAPIKPISHYNSGQYTITIMIHQDLITKNWWLQFHGEDIGYWPSTITQNLRNGAEKVSWGGQITNSEAAGHHTTTQMGSGHFPSEGFGKASYFRNLQFIDGLGNQIDADGTTPEVTNSLCYDLQINKNQKSGVYFFYGGPGFSAQCS